MNGVDITDMPELIAECRDMLSSYSGLFDESHGVCLSGPKHGELVPIDRQNPVLNEKGLSYHLTYYDFDGEGLWAWRLDGTNDTDCKLMLLTLIPTLLEEATDAL